MLIDLDEPFKSKWRKGYLTLDSKENRQHVILYNSNSDRSGMTYARYLLSVRLGYVVPKGYEADHINEDKTDDRSCNIQPLIKEDNRLKQEYNYIMNQQEHYGCYCAGCGTSFLITEAERQKRIAEGVEYPFCSRTCAAIFQHAQKPRIKDEDIALIKQLHRQGMSSYGISEHTGFSRNTIMKYW